MIIATVFYKGTTYQVQVLNTYTYANRLWATVKALPKEGRPIKPFTAYTHGGAAQEDTTSVMAASVKVQAIEATLPAKAQAQVAVEA